MNTTIMRSILTLFFLLAGIGAQAGELNSVLGPKEIIRLNREIDPPSSFDDLKPALTLISYGTPPSPSSSTNATLRVEAIWLGEHDQVGVGHSPNIFSRCDNESSSTFNYCLANEARVDNTTGDITRFDAYRVAIGDSVNQSGTTDLINVLYIPDTSQIDHVTTIRAIKNDSASATIETAGQIIAASGDEVASHSVMGVRTSRYVFPANSSSFTGAATTRDTAWCSLFYLPERTTWTKIGIRVTSAVADTTGRLAIYTDDGGPASLVLDAGTIDSSSGGDKEITISQQLEAGVYWGCLQPEGGSSDPSFNWATIAGFSGLIGQTSSTSTDTTVYFSNTGTYPSTAGSLTFAGAGLAPAIWLRK